MDESYIKFKECSLVTFLPDTSRNQKNEQLFLSDIELKLNLLQKQKILLNAWKGQLSHFDLNEWSQHTDSTNPGSFIKRRLLKDKREFFITNAFLKFCEILYHFPQLVNNTNGLKSFHLCEAPGAFVYSMMQYLEKTDDATRSAWQWKATSLHPHYEGHDTKMHGLDKFILSTWDNWFWCEDGTGNIISRNNILSIFSKHGYGTCNLVTADGSFNCTSSFGEQEAMVSRLKFAEIVTSMGLLSDGGNLVIKTFTFFEHSTLLTLSILLRNFKKITVVKPATSKAGNSEVYLVCEEFLRYPFMEKEFETLLSAVDDESGFKSQMIQMTEESFYSILRCNLYFAKYQSQAIYRNIKLWGVKDDRTLKNQIRQFNNCFADWFIQKFNLSDLLDLELHSEIAYFKYRGGFFDGLTNWYSGKEYSFKLKNVEEGDGENCLSFDRIVFSRLVHGDYLPKLSGFDNAPLNGWCKNVCFCGFNCAKLTNITDFFALIRRRIENGHAEFQHLQLFSRIQLGRFFQLASCFEKVFFYPAVNKIVFDGLLPNWENNWNVLLSQESSYFCIRIQDVLAGKFLRYHIVSDRTSKFFLRCLAEYNHYYLENITESGECAENIASE
ncbi:cap-specific mRNA (nucleoside-2'-O-)-methyltransferase 2-like isoform X3 [Artemia franciscana]|uniref:Cap-specific mRNA (nucleoside-2'-O-)-methyltransferase 2 n=1 Tax=Artemia franciscana TaxID=6661 RepID=A0AA88I1B5_ARTSF|nr:hypothetical protein QYM36_005516 [Artemia franciscana]